MIRAARLIGVPIAAGVALGSLAVAGLGYGIGYPRPFPDQALLGLWLGLPLALPPLAWLAFRAGARGLFRLVAGGNAPDVEPLGSRVGSWLMETLVVQAAVLSVLATLLDGVLGARIFAFERLAHPWHWILADLARGILYVALGIAVGKGVCRLSPRRAGTAVAGVAALSLLLNLGAGAVRQARRVNPTRVKPGSAVARSADPLRVIVYGVDGASWLLIDRMVTEGQMPMLSQALGKGSRATLVAEPPLYSPALWTSLGTGYRPSEHGVTSYSGWTFPGCRAQLPIRLSDRALYPLYAVAGGLVAVHAVDAYPATAELRRADELWERVSAWGGTVEVVNWPASYPATAVNGQLVSDAFFKEWEWVLPETIRTPKPTVYPDSLVQELAAVVTPPDQFDPEPLRGYGDFDEDDWRQLRGHTPTGAPLSMLAWDTAVDQNVFHTVRALQRRGPPVDLVMAKTALEDEIEHYFVPFRWPGSFDDVDPELAQRWRGILGANHRHLDSELGELFSLADEHTVILVVSDHGYRMLRHNPLTDEAHDPKGILFSVGGPTRMGVSGLEATSYDLAPTVLYLLGYAVPPELPGRVLLELFEPGFVAAHPAVPPQAAR